MKLMTVILSTLLATSMYAQGRSNEAPGRVKLTSVTMVDSPLEVTPLRAEPTIPERVAGVSWAVKNVSSRMVLEYAARVYIYRDGRAVGFQSTQQLLTVRPGKSQSTAINLDKALTIEPTDLVLIAVMRVTYDEDGTPAWEAPNDVADRVRAEVARHKGSVSVIPQSQLIPASFLMTPVPADYCGYGSASDYCSAERKGCIEACKVKQPNGSWNTCVYSFQCKAYACESTCVCKTSRSWGC